MYAQLLLHFQADPFETLHTLYDMHILRYAYCFFQNPEIIFYHIFFIFNLDFFRALILQKCIGSMYLLPATPPTV